MPIEARGCGGAAKFGIISARWPAREIIGWSRSDLPTGSGRMDVDVSNHALARVPCTSPGAACCPERRPSNARSRCRGSADRDRHRGRSRRSCGSPPSCRPSRVRLAPAARPMLAERATQAPPSPPGTGQFMLRREAAARTAWNEKFMDQLQILDDTVGGTPKFPRASRDASSRDRRDSRFRTADTGRRRFSSRCGSNPADDHGPVARGRTAGSALERAISQGPPACSACESPAQFRRSTAAAAVLGGDADEGVGPAGLDQPPAAFDLAEADAARARATSASMR